MGDPNYWYDHSIVSSQTLVRMGSLRTRAPFWPQAGLFFMNETGWPSWAPPSRINNIRPLMYQVHGPQTGTEGLFIGL